MESLLTTLKCKLFSFSLGDKASRWLKSLPAHSITTWDEYKAAFINHFYTKQRSISVRNKISNFRQANNESFYEALDDSRSTLGTALIMVSMRETYGTSSIVA
ncbi:unnamed protein product [Microthlaspi erraticum]|uniref:Retrotransposon gag domain-containing protein n=1 Tax=Microthlaspi erraticum TaxID=1685480 RepID=A0A6D2KH51_9BRAS|nr:unnamed protein product [Microthlaspi erraticum]